jgi:exodeoxyribonuclease VII large subunit
MLRIKSLQDRINSKRRQLEALSVTDDLTGLYNHRALQQRLRLHSPGRALGGLADRVEACRRRLVYSGRARLAYREQRLSAAVAQLHAFSPLAVISRGYSITRGLPSGRIVRRVSAVRPGDDLETRVEDGDILSRVKETKNIA